MRPRVERLGHSAPPSPLGQAWKAVAGAVPAAARVDVRRTAQIAHSISLHADDGLLLSYPKSGSTWLRNMLAIVIAGRETTPDEIAQLVPPLHMTRRRHLPGPTVFRSHDSIGTPGFDRAGRVVALVRDPRSVAVSYRFHLHKRGRSEVGVEDTAELMLGDGFEYLGSWQSHVDQLARAAGDRLLVVRYEDLLDAPDTWLTCIAEHLRVATTNEMVDLAVRLTRPDVLRQRRIDAGIERSDDTISDVRRASADSWHDECPAAVQAQILERAGEQMRWLRYAPLDTSVAAASAPRRPDSVRARASGLRSRLGGPGRTAPLIVIGAQKAGTLSLTHDLSACDGFVVDVTDKERSGLLWRGPEWLWRTRYLRQFPIVPAGRRPVDISTRYAMKPVEVVDVERLARAFDEPVKLVYVLREPISRARSHHHHDTILGLTHNDIDRAVTPYSRYVDNSRYALQIEHWLRAFPRDDVLLIDFAEYVANRAAVVERICRFAGVTTDGVERIDAGQVHNASAARSSMPAWLGRVVRSAPYRSLGRRVVPRALRTRVRSSAARAAPAAPPEPSPATLHRIVPVLREDQRALHEMFPDAPSWTLD